MALSIIPAATAASYITGAGIGSGVGEVDPIDWIIEEVTNNGITKITLNGGFSHFQEDDTVTITFPTGTFASTISMIAVREGGGSNYPINFSSRSGNPDVYSINRNDAVDGDSGISFCIVGLK